MSRTKQDMIEDLGQALSHLLDSHLEYCRYFGPAACLADDTHDPEQSECVIQARTALRRLDPSSRRAIILPYAAEGIKPKVLKKHAQK